MKCLTLTVIESDLFPLMMFTPWTHFARRAICVASTLALCVPAMVFGQPDYRTRPGRETTELAKAINRGDQQKVKELIALQPACVNERQAGYPPLHIAVLRTNAVIVKLLLDAGAKVDAIDSATREELMNYTALALASASLAWNQDIVELLISHGADVNKPDKFGNRPIRGAAGSSPSHPTTLEYLIANGAKIEVRDNNGDTPLMSAVLGCQAENVKILLAAGADPNAKNKKGVTALHVAVFRDCPAAIELLLASKANINARVRGKTPLQIALIGERTNCAAILQSHGAKK